MIGVKIFSLLLLYYNNNIPSEVLDLADAMICAVFQYCNA
jgi:hypothetical protein